MLVCANLEPTVAMTARPSEFEEAAHVREFDRGGLAVFNLGECVVEVCFDFGIRGQENLGIVLDSCELGEVKRCRLFWFRCRGFDLGRFRLLDRSGLFRFLVAASDEDRERESYRKNTTNCFYQIHYFGELVVRLGTGCVKWDNPWIAF